MKKAAPIIVIVVVAIAFILVGLMRKGHGTDQIRIAVVPKTTASVYWEMVRAGAEKAAAETGVKMFWNGPEVETDRERQKQIVEDFVVQKVSGIVLAPNDSKALVPSVEMIHQRGIPCVIIDSAIDTDKYVSFLATDNYKGGVMAAMRIGRILNGKGKVIIVAWTPNSASTDKRVKGFTETINKEFPDIHIVDSKYPNPPTVEQSLVVSEDMLQKNTDLDGIFACNRDTAVGAMQALQQSGRQGRVKMVGFDSDTSLINGLKDAVVDSLVIQNPHRMGYEGVKTILATLEGKKVPRSVDTGVELVTSERLNEPKIRKLLGLQ